MRCYAHRSPTPTIHRAEVNVNMVYIAACVMRCKDMNKKTEYCLYKQQAPHYVAPAKIMAVG